MYIKIQETDRKQKQNDIKEEITEEVLMHCSCKFTTSNIIDDTFSCRGSKGQFRNTVVYRGMIALQVPRSITDADDIVTYIYQWVQTKPSVRINGITLALDPSCPTVLDSFDSNDCVTKESPDQISSSSSSPLPLSVIIGAAVLIAIIILLVIIVIIVIVKYRKRKSTYRYCVICYLR